MIPGTHDLTIAEIRLAEARSEGIGTRLSDVEPERVEWLWKYRIGLGKLNVVDGNPDVGKSSVTLDIAARVTTGRPMPDESPGVDGAVVILSYEDGIADTIVPRLKAAGGDTRRVIVIDRVPDEKGAIRPPMIPEDIETAEAVIQREGAVLLIIDPLMAAMSGKVDAHRDQDVRRALVLISAMAEKTRAAIVVVRHLNKSGGGNPMYRGGGSIGIIGAARSGLLLARHPDDPDLRVLARNKGNLGPDYPSLAYRLEGTEIDGKDGPIETVRVVWEGETPEDATALLQPPQADDDSVAARAKEFLKTFLSAGEKTAAEVEAAAKKEEISMPTLKRVKRAAGARSVKTKGGWVWRLHISDPERQGDHPGPTQILDPLDPLDPLTTTKKIKEIKEIKNSNGQNMIPLPANAETEEPPW